MPVVKKQTAKTTRRKKTGSVLDRIQPIGFEGEEGIKINLYGRSGTGKTTLWSSFPGKILAIVCSGGNKPGELRSIDTPANRKKIMQAEIKSSSEIGELVEYAKDKFATVVLDHASGLQDLILKEVVGLDEIPAQLSWGIASQQQYGQVALQMKERLRSLLSMDGNVVIIAQERDFNSDSDNELLLPYVASALTPSVVGWLNPACDFIAQTFIRPKTVTKQVKIGKKIVPRKEVVKGQVEYCLRVGPDAVFTTKFRLPKGHKLPSVIIDPDYRKLLSVIEGKGD